MAVEFSIVEYLTIFHFEKNNRFQITDFFISNARACSKSARDILWSHSVAKLVASHPGTESIISEWN